jgi:chromosome segregation protein
MEEILYNGVTYVLEDFPILARVIEKDMDEIRGGESVAAVDSSETTKRIKVIEDQMMEYKLEYVSLQNQLHSFTKNTQSYKNILKELQDEIGVKNKELQLQGEKTNKARLEISQLKDKIKQMEINIKLYITQGQRCADQIKKLRSSIEKEEVNYNGHLEKITSLQSKQSQIQETIKELEKKKEQEMNLMDEDEKKLKMLQSILDMVKVNQK